MLELSPLPLTRGERPAFEVDTPDLPVKFNAGRKEFRVGRREGHPVLGMMDGPKIKQIGARKLDGESCPLK
jgi:hypothetical protein